MKIAVRYYSRSGNSKKLAEAVAAAVKAQAQDVSVPLDEKADVVFLCNAMYAGGVDDAVKAFVKGNATKIGKLVNVSSTAVAASTYKQIKKLAQENGVALSEAEFHCRGAFTVLHRGRPNEKDLAAAAAFAKDVVK